MDVQGGPNSIGDRASSVAVVGSNAFVALVTRVSSNTNLFGELVNNYLVGYVDADSVLGRVASQEYSPTGQFEVWASGLDQVTFAGAWQLVGGDNNWVYVANNDPSHNILVFELTALGVVSTDFRMETGDENIFAIDVDAAGYVYVVDYEGDDIKVNEVKVFSPIGTPGSTWDVPGAHDDLPSTIIDLPPGRYMGVTVSGDGSQVFVSSVDDKSILKFVGDPVNGYTQDQTFSATLSPDDIVFDEDGFRVAEPRFLGLAYLDDPGIVFAVVDTFLCSGTTVESCGGYITARIFVIDGPSGISVDTVDVAAWNLLVTGDYSTGSNNGRAGGFASIYDVDVSDEPALYSQSYYGWAVEKWVYDGDLGGLVSVESRPNIVPTDFSLGQNYPNPFNPSTIIEFEIAAATHVKLFVSNVTGQTVAILVDKQMGPGAYKVSFDASRLPSGVYYYSLESERFKSTQKMTLMR